jgi:serine/threonine protein kinase
MYSSLSPTPGTAAGVAHLIPRADIQIQDFVGRGGFGEVFRGLRKGGSTVAVKRLSQGLSAKSKAEFKREVAFLSALACEFVVQVYGVVDDSPDQPVLLVMELMHESLHDAVHASDPPPSLRQRIMWLVQAGKGIAFLHSAGEQGVIHRDIKPGNMLITSPDTGRRLKMGDFGLSKSLADITSFSIRTTDPGARAAGNAGTVHYMAPELFKMKPEYSLASDVYAFAVVAWEVVSMMQPYRESPDRESIKEGVRAGEREGFASDFPPAVKAMIERAWHQDPKQRPSIHECVRDLEHYLMQLPPNVAGASRLNSGGVGSASGEMVGGGGAQRSTPLHRPPSTMDSRNPVQPQQIPSHVFDFGNLVRCSPFFVLCAFQRPHSCSCRSLFWKTPKLLLLWSVLGRTSQQKDTGKHSSRKK